MNEKREGAEVLYERERERERKKKRRAKRESAEEKLSILFFLVKKFVSAGNLF